MIRKTVEELRGLIEQCPHPGSRWAHAKSGRKYYVVCRALTENTAEPAVVYQSRDTSLIWVRPLSEWRERFIPESQVEAGSGGVTMLEDRSPWNDVNVKAALKERRPADISLISCQECGLFSYYNDGSHFTCRDPDCDWTASNEAMDQIIEDGEVITLEDYAEMQATDHEE